MPRLLGKSKNKGETNMKNVYVALLTVCKEGGYAVEFPDLPGCFTQGRDLYEAIDMAEIALEEWLEYLADKNIEIPKTSDLKDIKLSEGQFTSLVRTRTAVSA